MTFFQVNQHPIHFAAPKNDKHRSSNEDQKVENENSFLTKRQQHAIEGKHLECVWNDDAFLSYWFYNI